jgi:hypothetical protein
MGNVVYFNGGAGIVAFQTAPTPSSIAIVNNTMYDNYWNVGNYIHPASGNLSWFRASNGFIFNNIMQAAPLTNTCYEGSGGGGLGTPSGTIACSIYNYGGSPNTFRTNVAFAGPVSFDPGGSDTFPTVGTNHNLNGSDPLLTSVTPSSQANNFALQGGSPAIGFGQAFDLWQQHGTVDAGACAFSTPGPVVHCP